MGSNGTHVIFRLEVSVPFVLSWDINAHQPFLGWMISSNVVSKCCQPMNHWSLCFSKRLYSEDTDYSVQATQMSKPWWINSELPPKTDVICYQHWYLPNDQQPTIYYSEWSFKNIGMIPANTVLSWFLMAGNTNYARFSQLEASIGDVPSCAALGLASPEAMHEPVMAREASNKKGYSTYMSWKLDL